MKINLLKRMKNYGFWMSLAGGVMLVLQLLGLKINVPYVTEIVAAVASVLVMLGIISNPTDGKGYGDSTQQSDKDSSDTTQQYGGGASSKPDDK